MHLRPLRWLSKTRLLRSSLAEDVVYTNPGVEGSGISNLLLHVEGFQKKFPGGSFRMNWLRQQHGQVLVEWTQLNQDGSELVTGPQLCTV